MNIKTWEEMIELDNYDYDNLLNSRKKYVRYNPYRHSTTKHKSTFGGELTPSNFTYYFPHSPNHKILVSKWTGER
jgi:hypothetical protein